MKCTAKATGLLRVLCAALVVTILTACSSEPNNAEQPAKEKPHLHLPIVGMRKEDVLRTMIDRGQVDSGANSMYDIDLDGHQVLVEVNYMRDSHGTVRLGLIKFVKATFTDVPEISRDMTRELEKEVLPKDAKVPNSIELAKAIASDKQDERSNEHASYVKSASLGRTLSGSAYYHRGTRVGKCPYAEPNVIQEFRRIENGHVVRVGFYSPYLNNCAMVAD